MPSLPPILCTSDGPSVAHGGPVSAERRRDRGARRAAATAGMLGAAALLGACEVHVAIDVEVGDDRTASIEVATAVDADVRSALEVAGLGWLLDGAAVAAAAPGWGLADVVGEDGWTLRQEFVPIDDVGEQLAALQAAVLPDADVLADITVVDDGSRVSFDAEAGLPEGLGRALADAGVRVDPDQFDELLLESVDEVVDLALRVTLPGQVTGHDGDRVDGRSVRWGPTSRRAVRVEAAATDGLLRDWALAAGALLAGGVIGVAAGRFVRRRRRR